MTTFKNYIHHQLKPLTIRLACILLLYSIFRVLFYFANADFFPNISKAIFLHGIRFDLSAIFYTNSLYILAVLLPFSFVYKKIYRRICNIYFVTINGFAFLFSCGDIAYFPFVLKRSTADLFSYINIGFDFQTLLPLFFKQYWYLFVLLIVVVALSVFLVKVTSKLPPSNSPEGGEMSSSFGGVRRGLLAVLFYLFFYCFVIFISVIIMRGGFQLRPLSLVDTGKIAGVENAALISNTPFSIIISIGKQANIKKHYFSSLEKAEQYMSPIHESILPRNGENIPIKNVLVIVLEGFSQYAIRDTNEQLEDYQGFAPFLYGLSQKAISFNGFANGKRTIEAIPAIFGGIPTLLDKSYLESSYSNNYVISPVKILKDKGYNTLFLYGAKNNSMNFENYCYSIGFNHFFGMNEYPNPDDWDGTWGISDRSYLRYAVKVLDTIRQPFFAGILTLSAHHPFVIPKDGKDLNLSSSSHPMMACINYTDYALKDFFALLSQYSWYNSTLFIITADHTGEGSLPAQVNHYQSYQIPLLFYHPLATSRTESEEMMQQIDIMPSLFSYLKITTPLFSYGRNVFDEKPSPFAVNYLAGIYQLFTPKFVLQFDGKQTIGLYKLPLEFHNRKNVMNEYPAETKALEQKLKALIESYSTRMAQNKLYNKSKNGISE